MIVASAQPFDTKGAMDKEGNVRKNFERQDCQQKKRNTYLLGLYYRHDLRGAKAAECAVLGETRLKFGSF